MKPEPRASKKAYVRPLLRIYGSLQALTASSGGNTVADAGTAKGKNKS